MCTQGFRRAVIPATRQMLLPPILNRNQIHRRLHLWTTDTALGATNSRLDQNYASGVRSLLCCSYTTLPSASAPGGWGTFLSVLPPKKKISRMKFSRLWSTPPTMFTKQSNFAWNITHSWSNTPESSNLTPYGVICPGSSDHCSAVSQPHLPPITPWSIFLNCNPVVSSSGTWRSWYCATNR